VYSSNEKFQVVRLRVVGARRGQKSRIGLRLSNVVHVRRLDQPCDAQVGLRDVMGTSFSHDEFPFEELPLPRGGR